MREWSPFCVSLVARSASSMVFPLVPTFGTQVETLVALTVFVRCNLGVFTFWTLIATVDSDCHLFWLRLTRVATCSATFLKLWMTNINYESSTNNWLSSMDVVHPWFLRIIVDEHLCSCSSEARGGAELNFNHPLLFFFPSLSVCHYPRICMPLSAHMHFLMDYGCSLVTRATISHVGESLVIGRN